MRTNYNFLGELQEKIHYFVGESSSQYILKEIDVDGDAERGRL